MLARIARALCLLLALFLPSLAHAQFPTPTYDALTVNGKATLGSIGSTGPASLLCGGQLGGTFSGTSTITGLTAGLQSFTTAQLATLTGQPGWTVYNSDCVNGGITGCLAVYTGTSWTPVLTPQSFSMTIGGQNIALGGATLNMGNGDLIQTATGTPGVSGNCPQYNASSALVDSGAPCAGGTGGAGTVTAGPQFAIPSYSGGGSASVLSALAIVNNAVLSTNGTGVPAESTTLPPGLSIPTPAISGATLTGSTLIGPATYTGKQTYLASTVGLASANIPAGVAPTAPADGDEWATSAGRFYRAGSTTQGPFLYNVSTTAPLTGGGLGPSLTVACPTCATTTNGGALTATLPVTISAAGVIALGPQVFPLTWIADSAYIVHNDTYPIIDQWPYTGSGTIKSVVAHTGGTTSPSFQVTLATCTGGVGGTCTNVGGCANIIVQPSTPLDTVTTCSAPNTISANQTLEEIISGVSGSPSSAVVQTNVSRPGA
jgi:hypothetical protein